MANPFLCEIRIMSFGFAPKGWAECNGQLLPINQNQALFSLIGTTYGGDGQRTFGLPNLQGRVPMHAGNGHVLGEMVGEESHLLIYSEMPLHTHTMLAVAASANNANASSARALAEGKAAVSGQTQSVNLYGTGDADLYLAAQQVGNTGGSQPHENRQPFLALRFCIALQGIYPSQG